MLNHSPVCRPDLIKDIPQLGTIRCRASKYILSYWSMGYKSRLTSLLLLPLMMQFELGDIICFVKSFKFPSSHFNLMDYFPFSSKVTDCLLTLNSIIIFLNFTLPDISSLGDFLACGIHYQPLTLIFLSQQLLLS